MRVSAPRDSRPPLVAHYVASAFRHYGLEPDALMDGLPIPAQALSGPLPPVGELVGLPDWAADVGVDGHLLVPAHLVGPGEDAVWRRTDWLTAIAWYLHAEAERGWEGRDGPVHSYAARLRGWDTRFWDAAWVNRIVLFLVRWAQRHRGEALTSVSAPNAASLARSAEVVITHDVDAVRKTVPIRLKQAAFHLFNAARTVARGDLARGSRRVGKALRFLAAPGRDYWNLERIAEMERARGLTSIVFVHGGGPPRTLRRWVFDPSYRVADTVPAECLRRLAASGFTVGVHPSFDAWSSARALAFETAAVEQALGRAVTHCRQHWLRFGWSQTWRAQAAAGLTHDWTCGFNDRPGFRLGAAMSVRPWQDGAALPLTVTPTVLMDSHLYDYADLDAEQRRSVLSRWVGEVRAVGGRAAVIWHQRVIGRDYGWGDGFVALLDLLAGRTAHSADPEIHFPVGTGHR